MKDWSLDFKPGSMIRFLGDATHDWQELVLEHREECSRCGAIRGTVFGDSLCMGGVNTPSGIKRAYGKIESDNNEV